MEHNYTPFMKAKAFDETAENYVIGTIQGAFKTKRHWMKKGFDEDSSIEKAVSYAFGQIMAGTGSNVSLEDAEKAFREISAIAHSFADACKQLRGCAHGSQNTPVT